SASTAFHSVADPRAARRGRLNLPLCEGSLVRGNGNVCQLREIAAPAKKFDIYCAPRAAARTWDDVVELQFLSRSTAPAFAAVAPPHEAARGGADVSAGGRLLPRCGRLH